MNVVSEYVLRNVAHTQRQSVPGAYQHAEGCAAKQCASLRPRGCQTTTTSARSSRRYGQFCNRERSSSFSDEVSSCHPIRKMRHEIQNALTKHNTNTWRWTDKTASVQGQQQYGGSQVKGSTALPRGHKSFPDFLLHVHALPTPPPRPTAPNLVHYSYWNLRVHCLVFEM